MNILNREKKENIFFYVVIFLTFIVGIFIRTKLYLLCDYLEDDECRIAIAMMDKHFWQMFEPMGPLSVTPLFFGISKIIAVFFKYNEYALKFIPFTFSICSLFLFYKICKEYFSRKISVCLSLILLSANKFDIYFSSIFKTYSLEVLITLLCLYYFPKINLFELSRRRLIYLSVIITILPLISLPSLYFIFLFILINLYKTYKTKSSYTPIIKIVTPFILVLTFYYFITLAPTKLLQLETYPEFWGKYLHASFASTFAIVYRFLNNPNSYVLSVLILTFSSILYIFCNKNEHTEMNFYITFSYILAILGSLLSLYPITVGRTALFLLPVMIILAVKLIDVLKVKSVFMYITVFLLVISYYKYFTFEYLKTVNNVLPTFRNYSPKVLMKDLASGFNKNTDIVITTEASMFSYVFYAIKENVPLENLDFQSTRLRGSKNNVYEYLNSLSPDKNYYLYLIKEYKQEPLRKYIQEWLNNQQVEYSRKENDSYLYYIRGEKMKKIQ